MKKEKGRGLDGERHRLERDRARGGILVDKDSLVQLRCRQGITI